jgi:ATP-dependent DNA helicase DinG
MRLQAPGNKEPDLAAIFSRGGLLEKKLPGFEYREEQLKMADAVLGALSRERTLIVEAGTGVGKSLAYLIPLALWLMDADTPRAIVSTYSKALQRQLFENELPFIKRHFSPQIRYAVSFGSENYVCLRRLDQARQFGLFDPGEKDTLPLLMEWVKETATGLRGEVPLEAALWQKVSREADLCSGGKCRFYQDCFFQTAKAVERKANIVITNHHLFFAHVAANYSVLPDAHCVVFDEAHEIEEVASDHLCVEVSSSRLRYILDSIISSRGKGLLLRLPWLDGGRLLELSSLVDRARKRGEVFFLGLQELLGGARSVRLRSEPVNADEASGSLLELYHALAYLSDLPEEDDEKMEILAAAERVNAFRDSLDAISRQAFVDHVYWLSQETRTIRAASTPVNVSRIISEKVFGVFMPAILTSATLSVDNSFRYIQGRLGLEEATTDLLASPFEYRKQALLYIPGSMPGPHDEDFAAAVAGQVEAILNITQGSTLVLFTSYALLHDVAGRVSTECLILKQGDMDNFLLLEEFRMHKSSVLFGTYAFWQGIDLQGDLLKCVIIVKLPFSVPSEPVLEARMEKILSRGGDPFLEYQVPEAVITFKQGFGRLIRSKSDRGVAAVLDTRIMKKHYGRFFLKSLPDMEITDDLAKVEKFMADQDETS